MTIINKNGTIRDVQDQIETVDAIEKILNGRSPNNKRHPKFYTEVDLINGLGEVIHRQHKHNELLLSGGLFVLAKISGVDIPLDIKTINSDLNINVQETTKSFTGPRREDVIQGFMVGIDGCDDMFDTVKPVYTKQRTITAPIPFSMVEDLNELSDEEKARYALTVHEDNWYKSYLKHFESTPQIFCEFDEPGAPPVPATVDLLESDSVINTYIRFMCKINEKDLRTFYKEQGGGLRKARMNTLALVTGYPDGNDYKGCRCFSKINFNNEPFDNETKELTFSYKIFI